jgi:hypothetical protein
MHYLKPNADDIYWAQPTQSFLGLWTPYGVVCPYILGIASGGEVTVTYLVEPGAKFTKAQQKKLKYIKGRGAFVDIMLKDKKD